jgi:hypothetical protein
VYAIGHAECLVLRQRSGYLAGVADLPSVPTSSLLDVLSKVVPCEVYDGIHVNLHCGTLTPLELFEIGLPDLH